MARRSDRSAMVRTCACTTREPCLALTVGGLGLVLLMMCSSWRQELTMDPMRLWNAAGSTAVERERFVERTFGRQRLEQLIARPSSAEPGAIVGAAELRDLFALDRQVHALTATVAPADLPAARAASWTGLYTVDAAAACPAGCCCVQGDFELLDAGADAALFGEGAGGQGVSAGLRRAVSVRADVGNPVAGACPGAVFQKDFVPSVHSSAVARGPADGRGAALTLSIFNQSTSLARVDADTLRVELHANATAAAGSGGGSGSGAARCPALLARRRLDFRLEDLCFRVGVGGSPLGCLQFHPLAMWALDTTHAVSNPTPGQYFEAALDADVAADGEGAVQDKLLHWDGWADLFNGGLQPLLTNPWTANSTTLAYNNSANAAFAKERVWRAPRGTPANVTALQVWWFLDDSDARRALYPPGVWRQALSSWEGAFAGLVPAGAPRLDVIASAEKSYGDDIGAGIVADLPALGAAMGLTLLAAALLAARAGAARDAPGAAGERGGGTAAAVVHASSGAVVGGGGALLVLAAVLGAFGLCTAVSALPAVAAGGGGGAHEETADDGSGMAAPTGRPRALPNSPFSMYALLLLVALGAWQLLLVSELFARAAAAQLAALLSAAAKAKAKAGQHPSAAPLPDGEEGGVGGGGGGTASARGVDSSSNSSSSSSSSAVESIAAELYARGSAAVYCTAIYAMAFIMHNLPCMQGWVVATLGAAAWAVAARAERLARAAAAAGMRAPCRPSPFVRWPRLALGAARAATGGTAAAFCAYLAVGAAQRQRLTGSSVWLGCVSNFIACAWSARCVVLARRQQERFQRGGGGGGGGGSADCCGEELGGHGGVEPQGHWHAGPDGGFTSSLPPLPPAARACLSLDAAAPPALPAFDWHPAMDRVAAQRALAAAEPVLLGGAVAALLLLLTAAAVSSLPAVRAFCAMAAAGVVVLHGAMVWVLPALLQLRWQQLKRQLWWLEPRLRRGGAAAGGSSGGGGSGGGSRWSRRALPALLLSLLVMLALCARTLAQTQLRQRFGREDVLPASSALHRFFAAQEALFEAVLPMALVSRGLDYGREAAFGPLTAAHAGLSACGAVDLSQGAGGVVDWYSQPGGPSPGDPGSAVQPDLASQTPLMTYLLSNRSSFGGGVPMHSFCAQWNSFLCPAGDDDDAPPPFPACPGACALGVANITGAAGTPAVPTFVPGLDDAWPHASVMKLWAVSEPDFFGQAFAQDLAFANASAASTLALVCGPQLDPKTQQPVPCQHGDDSLRAGALRAAKSSLFSRALADARDMEEQRAVRDAVQRAVAPAADALRGGSALAGDDGSSAAGAADPALSADDPLFVHSLLFVVLEQFDALREQAKLNLLLGAVAVALAPALAALLARRGRARGGRGEDGKRRAAAAGAATSVSRSVLLPLAVAGASLAAGAASGADLLGLMAPACFSIAISSTSANIVLFLPVLLCFLAAAACAEAAAAAGDGGVGTEAVWRWSPASPTSPTSPATAALRTTLAAVLGGALPCLALASPANQQVATMYVLAAVLAVLHAAALGGAVRLLSRRVSGRPSALGTVVHSSSAPLLAFE